MKVPVSAFDLLTTVNIPEGQSGDWAIQIFEVTKAASDRFNLSNIFSRHTSRNIEPGTYTRLVNTETKSVMMSDTPAERRDHYMIVREGTGHVLIHGLGIGMVVNALLKKPDVTKITVIEKSEDIIKLVAPSYDDPRVEIIQADALTWDPGKNAKFDAVWHDIWPEISIDNWEEITFLHRRYGRRTKWQGTWARHYLEQMLREDRRYSCGW